MDFSRKTAFDVLVEIEKNGSYSNLALNRFIGETQTEKAAVIREIVHGVTANRIFLDYYLNNFIPSGIEKVRLKEKTILRMGLYQIMFRKVPGYAAVNESVELAKKVCRGREGFINGVLRNCIREIKKIKLPDENNRKDYLSVKYSFPQDIIEMWDEQYGSEICEKIMEAFCSRAPMSVRVNLLKTDADSLEASLRTKGFETERGAFSDRCIHIKGRGIMATDEYLQGAFSVQDQASILAADYLDAKAGETVVDVCAAPGGKTAAIAEKMDNTGIINACDIYDHKLSLIEEQAERLGITIIKTQKADGRTGIENFDGRADRVLADVPCSGLGVIRRKPEIKYNVQKNISQLLGIQRDILQRSSKYLRNGGTMIYSTCTINKNENEKQAEAFLNKNENFEMLWQKQFMPTAETDGFYICKMIKRG